MIDLECMIKSLRLAWLKRIFSENEGTWKNYVFDITKKRSKHYYPLSINKKAQFPSTFNKLRGEFHFSIDSLQKVFMLPHKVALKPYVKAFQYKILNSILYTNT